MGCRGSILALWAVATLGACDIPIAARGDDTPNNPNCGDGVLDGQEICDDGNTASGDGCNATCSSDETCGNGVIDDGVEETCDDGNLLGGDGCSADCKSDESCGNGVIDLAKGETCDDGNLQGGDGCSANCQSNEACGNGITDVTEECDDGLAGSASCDVNCTVATCGDGTVNALRGEQCEDGNTSSSDACINCRAAFCGDGFVRAGVEQCDDGNTANGDGCNANCQREPKVYVLSNIACDPTTSTCSSNEFFGFVSDCSSINGTPSTNPYDSCSGTTQTGWTWQDSTPFQPSMIVMEVNHGIACTPTITAVTTINNVPSGNFQLTNAGGCNCTPTEVLNSWTFTGAQLNGFVRNGTNTLAIAPIVNCFGISFSEQLNGYVRITMFP